MPRRIVFINQATGYLTIDIINAFSKEYEEVAYIYGDLRVQDAEVHPKAKRSKIIEKSRKSNHLRFRRWLIATFQIFFLLLTKYRRYEIFYFSVPPFAYFSSLFFKRKFSILMWDVFPDALKLAGFSEDHFIYKTWTGINRRLFKKAHRIFTTGEGQAELLKKYTDPEKINVIHLWPGLRDAGPVDKMSNPFIREHGLNDKFIVEYSGNMGGTHNVEVLIEVARLMAVDNDVIFLLIGRGTKMEKVKTEIVKHNLTNVMLLPFQPDDVIKYSLAAADLNVVLIETGAASVSIPSKIYNLLALGSALMTISPEESEVNRLVEKYRPGENFDGADLNAITGFITLMKNSPENLEKYRANAIVASRDFSVSNARKFVDIYLS